MKKIIVPLIIGIFIIIFVLGFVEVDNTDTAVSSDTIVYSVTSVANNLEKVTGLSKREEDIICATSKGLIKKDSKGEIVSELAKEINVKDDGIEYEFILNDNIYWSNGDKITPDDIKGFFKELIKSEDEENIKALLDVYGAKAFRDGEGSFDKGVAITTGDNSIKIRLNKKNDEFLDDSTKPQYRIRKLLPVWGNIKDTYNELLYSGDYMITAFDDNKITLSKNKWGEGPNTIDLVKDDNEELAMASFEIGKRDVVINPPNSQLEKLKSENKLLTFSSDEAYYLSINSDENGLPLSSRREIYKHIYKATDEFMDNNPERVESAEGSYFREDKEDLTKLQTRKVTINQDGELEKMESLTLLAEDSDESRDLCKFLASWFKDNLSINLKYSLVKAEDLDDLDLLKRYDIALINIESNSNEKKEFYTELSTFLNDNEKLILEEEINDGSKEFKKIEEKLFNDCTIIPVMFSNENIAVSSKVSDISVDGNGNIEFSSIGNEQN